MALCSRTTGSDQHLPTHTGSPPLHRPIFHADSAAVTFQVVATGTAVVTARVKKHPICARVGATRDEWQSLQHLISKRESGGKLSGLWGYVEVIPRHLAQEDHVRDSRKYRETYAQLLWHFCARLPLFPNFSLMFDIMKYNSTLEGGVGEMVSKKSLIQVHGFEERTSVWIPAPPLN